LSFNRPTDIRYRKFLGTLHQNVTVDWYLEVGCRQGHSLAHSRSKSIAVDPFFRMETNVINEKPVFHTFQMTSDAFFGSGFLEKNDIRLGLSFLDGMHLFEYLLRDFIATERNSLENGFIMLHDCCPFDSDMTTRDLDNLPPGAWTGDVWKLIPILQQYRPDLTMTVLGCKPSGLVIINGLNPDDDTLTRNYDKIVADHVDVSIDDYGPDKFYGLFDYTKAEDVSNNGYAFFDSIAINSEAVPQWVTP
jgi:hypothetical protein